MSRNRSRRNAMILFALSPAFVDVFALLAIQSHLQRVEQDKLIKVQPVDDSAGDRLEATPLIIKVMPDGQFELKGQVVNLEEVESCFPSLEKNRKILVHLTENEHQMVSGSAFIQLSRLISKHELADRAWLVSKQDVLNQRQEMQP